MFAVPRWVQFDSVRFFCGTAPTRRISHPRGAPNEPTRKIIRIKEPNRPDPWELLLIKNHGPEAWKIHLFESTYKVSIRFGSVLLGSVRTEPECKMFTKIGHPTSVRSSLSISDSSPSANSGSRSSCRYWLTYPDMNYLLLRATVSCSVLQV